MGGVDQAPARIDIRVVQQPVDRTGAERRDAILDFPGLLGGMDVDRTVQAAGDNALQRLRRHRAQRMRRNADTGRGQCGDDVARPRD